MSKESFKPASCQTDVIRCGECLDCGFEDTLNVFEEEYEYDEFKGIDNKYYICPKCGGGVETYSHYIV